jgi:hypothetical protein
MATKQIKKQLDTKLAELRVKRGSVEDDILETNEKLSQDLPQNIREDLEKQLEFNELQLEKIDREIDELREDKSNLDELESDVKDYKWKDIEPLVKNVVDKHHMSYCVETNKFIYCMDMASNLNEDIIQHGAVNPQFRNFDGSKIQTTIGKLIDKYIFQYQHRLIKWFMDNHKTHFAETASFQFDKWQRDKVYNKAQVIYQFWVNPDMTDYENYNKDFDLLLYCVGGGKDENIKHLEIWPVYKWCFPDRVANTPNLDVCGPRGANGKGRYLELNKTIFTHGCVSPGAAKELADGFNSSWEMSTLVYFDEPTEKELPEAKVKNATGGEEQRIEKKGVDAYTADRNYSIMALSNNERGVFKLNGGGMAGQDRRFSVISTDIIMIDEIMKRENCTFEEATLRTNKIAQLVKDRKEVAKFMGHIMVKHDILNMKILPPLHGEDYNKRFEDQKDRMTEFFDQILPIFKDTGVMPGNLLVEMLDKLFSSDKKPIKYQTKTVNKKFELFLQKHKVNYELVPKQNVDLFYQGSLNHSFTQKAVFYYEKGKYPRRFDMEYISEDMYRDGIGLSKLKISID